MSGPAIKAPRSDLFNIRPDSDTVVIRMITDQNHPEFDERALDPIDENLIADILARGQHTPATGYKSGKDEDGRDIVTLMFGRQRWKAVSEIWNRFRADGLDMSLAPSFRIYIQVPKNDAVKRELRISENRHRKPLEGLALAREVREYLNIVGESEESLEHARVLFNFVSSAALRNCLALLETTPAVQEQLTAGTLSPTGALQLSRQAPEVQDAVAERIAQGAESDEGADDDDCSESAEASSSDTEEQYAERPAKTKPVPVSEVREMIREATGKKAFEMVTLKQVEKQIERKEAELEKALTKLEQCPTSTYDSNYQKTVNQAGKVAEIQGELKALRWARGETTASGSDAPLQGNDKMSAAWDALRDAIASAPWPKVLDRDDFEWPEIPRWDSEEDGVEAARDAAIATRQEYNDRITASHLLVVAGEKVARRDVDSKGKTYNIQIDTDSKWFTRLMDPFGKPSQLVREWGAHGYLESQGKAVSTPTYKASCGDLCKGRTAIQIKRGDLLAKWLVGTPLEIIPVSVSEVVREVIGSFFSERHIHHEIKFHVPYLEEGDGPDLGETLETRKEILSLIEKELKIQFVEGDHTWTTVGDLVAAIEAGETFDPASDAEIDSANCDQDDDSREAGNE